MQLQKPNRDTYSIDPTKIESAITKINRDICVVHLYDAMADMDAIWRITKQHQLTIEDVA